MRVSSMRRGAARGLARGAVERDVGEPQQRRVAVGAAPQQRAHAREQLVEVERLHDVVVRAGVEPGDPVGDGLTRGQHQHGRAVAARAQPPAHLEPVDIGHQDVEQHQVGRRLRQCRQGGPAAFGLGDVVAGKRERAAQGVAHGTLIVDDQDLHPVPS